MIINHWEEERCSDADRVVEVEADETAAAAILDPLGSLLTSEEHEVGGRFNRFDVEMEQLVGCEAELTGGPPED